MKSITKVYCDGGSRGNPGPAAAAFAVERAGSISYKDSRFLGKTTNNIAEYSAVVLALEWLSENAKDYLGAINIVLDSELVARQLAGRYKIKSEKLRDLYYSAKNLEKKIKSPVMYKSVRREKNKIADYLVNKTLDENV